MDEDQIEDSCITINFDDGNEVRLNKSFLTKHSPYFGAMFCGKFVESQAGHQIQLKNINYQGFMSAINSLKHNRIIFDSLEDVLLVLETSQLLQFTDTIKKSVDLIKERYLFTRNALHIFSLTSMLGLKALFDKARVYILYNFKMFLMQNRDSFFQINEDDLLLLLNDTCLNVENEVDVYNLVIDWCKNTNSYNMEYKMATSCVRFNSMNTNQLQNCISKTNNLNLQSFIKNYLNRTNQSEESVGLLIRPVRSIPNVLCAMKNENEGAYIYCWDWAILKFTRFMKVEPLPVDTTGYHVIVNGMDIFVMAGEISYGRGFWNEAGWRYNLLSEQWKIIENFIPSKRRHGVGHFCGKELYLLGGLTKHRLPNGLIERFRLENDTLVRVKSYLNNFSTIKIDRNLFCCLEYKNLLVLVTKYKNPMWYELCVDTHDPPYFMWKSHTMNLKATVICAISYLDNVYILAYNEKFKVVLILYCPTDQSCKELKCFKTFYDCESTMCAFNVNKAMVFGENILECYCIDNSTSREYTIQLDSFRSNYFFSIPIY